MTFVTRRLFAAVCASALLATSLPAEAKHVVKHAKHGGSWEGTWSGAWSGAWGGRDATAITVAGNRVVSYQYGGQTTPVINSKVTAKKIVYGDNGTVVTMTRTSANTAHATIHTSQGDGTAELTRG